MKAYKGTDKNLKCQQKQYEVGKDYKHCGSISMCQKGFHACENPLDVFNFYTPNGQNRFFEVEQSGKTQKDDTKTVSQQIKISAELSLKQFFEIGFKFIFDKVKKSKKTSNTSGDEAHSNTSGYYAHSNTSGYYAHSNTSGYEAIACALGIQSKAKAINGWIIIVNWRYDEKWSIKNIHHAKVGHKIKGVKIKPDTHYWFENGILKHKKI